MAGMSTALTTTGGGYTGLSSSSSYVSTYQSYNWGSYSIPSRNYGYSNNYWAVPREERKRKKKEKTKELSEAVERRRKKQKTRALSEEPPVTSSTSSSSAAAGSSSPPPSTGAVQSTSVWALFSSIWRRVSMRPAANRDSSVEKPEQHDDRDFKLQNIAADEHSSGKKPEPDDDDDDDGLKLLHINSDDQYSSAEEPELEDDHDDDDEYFSAEEPELEKDSDLQKPHSISDEKPEEHKLIEHSDQKGPDTDSDDQWRALFRRRRDICLGITSTRVPEPSEEGTDLLEALDLHGYESRSEKSMEAQSRRRRDISRRIIGNWKDGLDQDEVKGLQNYVGYLKKKYGNILSEKSSVESIILGETEFNTFSDPFYVQSMLSSSYDLLFLKL